MITDFHVFGPVHLLSLLAAVLLGSGFIIWSVQNNSDRRKKTIRLLLATTLILIRGSRYIMDVVFGVFQWSDLLSLHICHIDLLLLLMCLIRPNKAHFSFCFLIGIPTALSVALFPGKIHPAPGVPRAVLFIMSHMMLVMGALYLAIAEGMKPTMRMYAKLAAIGNIFLFPVFLINRLMGTNYLYIMEAPKGTVLVFFEKVFGWPGYIAALDILALILMLFMVVIGQLLFRLTNSSKKATAVYS